ncbi:hypothetical protein FMM05_07730 [Flavobacterium zepuense]|uniref:Lipoprotein n=1 Tax=Flavobacterium zepuense TaxID=2593302 RepID=A0A552V414_9FLAO|nr:hypothetical protein [Flavobacterium zepuense]TRW25187.1 hypothetical protein FMM05_07730 [Flavobacterium zepuense]
MKTLLAPGLCLALLFASCTTDSTDDALYNTSNTPQAAEVTPFFLRIGSGPANANNVYDYTGELYNEILDDAIANSTGTGVSNVVTDVNTAATSNSAFTAISLGYTGITTTTVSWVISNSSNDQTIINSTGASTRGKQELSDFVDLMEALPNRTYDEGYDAIAAFEHDIINDSTLNSLDKRIILSATSIARYSLYRTFNNGGDKSWTKHKTGVYGGITGADASTAKGVTTGVSSSLAQ